MKDFPILEDEQVVVVRAQKSTGIILDETYNKLVSDDQNMFTIFQNIGVANAYIEENKRTRNDIEFIIYGKGQIVLSFFQ